jgi:hypothetical protein
MKQFFSHKGKSINFQNYFMKRNIIFFLRKYYMNLKFLNEHIIRFFSLSLKKLIFTYWEIKYEAYFLGQG